MGTYFKPLRRKLGVATLMLACVFAMGWVRSSSIVDHWCHTDFKSYYACVDSSEGLISVGIHRHLRKNKWKFLSGYFNGYSQFPTWVTRVDLHFPESAGWKSKSKFDQFGLKVATAENRSSWNEVDTVVLRAHYSSIVIPLTFLTAYLLLSKPRARPQKPASEA